MRRASTKSHRHLISLAVALGVGGYLKIKSSPGLLDASDQSKNKSGGEQPLNKAKTQPPPPPPSVRNYETSRPDGTTRIAMPSESSGAEWTPEGGGSSTPPRKRVVIRHRESQSRGLPPAARSSSNPDGRGAAGEGGTASGSGEGEPPRVNVRRATRQRRYLPETRMRPVGDEEVGASFSGSSMPSSSSPAASFPEGIHPPMMRRATRKIKRIPSVVADDGVATTAPQVKEEPEKKKDEEEALPAAPDPSSSSTTAAATATRMLKRMQSWQVRPPTPCDRYNALGYMVGWKTRRVDCNSTPNCVFVGRSVTGWCVEKRDAQIAAGDAEDEDEEDEEEEYDYYYLEEDDEEDPGFPTNYEHEGPMVETQLLASLITSVRQEGIEQPMRLLITGSLAEAMTDSMKSGQSGTNELAKQLVLEALADRDTPSVIKHLLRNPAVRTSTRNLIYWLVQQDYTTEETYKLLKWQLDWVLVKNKWTEQSLATTFNWLLQTKMTHDALVPLLEWSFCPNGPIPQPAVELVVGLIPTLEEVTTWALKSSIEYALKDEYVKTLARDSVKDMLLSKITQMMEAQKEVQAKAAAAREREEEAKEGGEERGPHVVEKRGAKRQEEEEEEEDSGGSSEIEEEEGAVVDDGDNSVQNETSNEDTRQNEIN